MLRGLHQYCIWLLFKALWNYMMGWMDGWERKSQSIFVILMGVLKGAELSKEL